MKTPRSALLLAAAVALAMLILPAASPATVRGQATPFGAISCPSNYGNSVLLDKKYFHLVVAAAAGIARLQTTKPALSARLFAGGKFPFEQLDIYLAEIVRGANNPEESDVSLDVRAVPTRASSPQNRTNRRSSSEWSAPFYFSGSVQGSSKLPP